VKVDRGEGYLLTRGLKAAMDGVEGHRRSLSLASQHSGHMSHPHWCGTNIFINHK
jgi:hypothetical protein